MANYQIKETIDKHQQLYEQLKNNKLDKNLIIYNLPIKFNDYRGAKSFIDQIIEESEEELNNTTYNELYLPKLGLKITNDDIKFVLTSELTGWSKPGENIGVLQTHDETDNPIEMFKPFDWDDESVPEMISTHVENIVRLENEIENIMSQIHMEKSKIRELEYVISKLNKNVEGKDKYIQTLKYLCSKFKL